MHNDASTRGGDSCDHNTNALTPASDAPRLSLGLSTHRRSTSTDGIDGAGASNAVPAQTPIDTGSQQSSTRAERPHLPHLNVASANQDAPHSATTPASATEVDRATAVSLCASCHEDRIHGLADVWEAAKITWHRQRAHLFTSWIHVPLGVAFILVLVWALKLASDLLPFRFPAAVLAAFGLFGLLLLLDWLSDRFPGAELEREKDTEAALAEKTGGQTRKRKRFLDPLMVLLAPPCDFCLRNMSVMFTPSFILIPAREIIPGKEIGLIAVWFTVSQFAAFVIPILLNWGLNWLWTVPSRVKRRRQATKWRSKRKEVLSFGGRKSSITSVRNGSNAGLHNPAPRGSTATIVGLEFEKGVSFSGGVKLGPVASGLAGVTATVTAPVAHIQIDLTFDELRHIDAVGIELARQQGDPEVERIRLQSLDDTSRPRSDVSYFSHARASHAQHHHLHVPGSPRAHEHEHGRGRRPRSLSVIPVALGEVNGEQGISGRSRSADPSAPTSVPPGIARTLTDPLPLLNVDIAPATPKLGYRFPPSRAPTLPPLTVAFKQDLPTAAALRAAETASPSTPGTRRGSQIEILKDTPGATPIDSRRPSIINGIDMFQSSAGAATGNSETHNVKNDAEERRSVASSSTYGPDAVERLASWMGDLITPAIYFLFFLVGLPLWFKYDFALLLFLAANLLCFIAGITIVPARVRRFLHPILSCSITTVLIVWAFGAIKGLSIKETLAYYSNGAKYTVLWDPKGYNGPVPGAGDVLFSTLDAGIVALAIPMYRYRIDLKENFVRMVSALIPCAALSLFFWPWVAHMLGMDEVRSLAFAARFMSTPLAIQLANNVGADKSITVILVVITGIVFAVFKDPLFRLMRVKDDMTIGLTMGSTAGAIGASSLIAKPRQMAIASLSFILFGTLLLIATAIPQIVVAVQKLAGPELLKGTTGA